MKLQLVCLTAAISLLPAAANAQFTVQMGDIRCEQYLAMAPTQSRGFSSWMGGWYSYKIGKTSVDLIAHEKNIANVKEWCKYHPKDTVMSGLDKSIGGK